VTTHRFPPAVCAIACAVTVILAGFATVSAQKTEPAPAAPDHAAHEKHWAYETTDETEGPEAWGALPGAAACAVGKSQSPVALASASATARDLPNLAFAYGAVPLRATNNGHTVQFDAAGAGTVTADGVTYTLSQFHFHAPSEHTLDGRRYPMEMHLVHLDAAGNAALVVGVFLEEGAENAALAPAFHALPRAAGETLAPAGERIDPSRLLPKDRTYFAYSGSLTTPPCTEGLKWYVLRTPVTLSAAQAAAYASLPHLAHSNRPVQPFGERKVLLDTTP
jgi:carbonic anhydrase